MDKLPSESNDHLVRLLQPLVENEQERGDSSYLQVDRRSARTSQHSGLDLHIHGTMPRPSHWSVAWSDLMMTMFVLFLSMYVYQTANQQFLEAGKPEIIGGDTTEAIESLPASEASFPFSPIHPGLPLMTGGTIKKVEPVTIDNIRPDDVFTEQPAPEPQAPETETLPSLPAEPEMADSREPEALVETVALVVPPSRTAFPEALPAVPEEVRTVPSPEEVVQPSPILPQAVPSPEPDSFQEMYRLGTGTLNANSLTDFARIDLVPDNTMRIILTSDLLFALGKSDLGPAAKESLMTLAGVIRETPYMINVVGHTDNVPMRSNNFSSNWELSVARASTVARFLIDSMGMNPNQFVVSGFASYRPLVPNTTVANRAKNRRVEIIISKRLPQPVRLDDANLN